MNFNYDLGKIDTILTLDTTESPALGGQTNVLVIQGSGAIALPAGGTAAQPASPAAGMLRWNSDGTVLEYYDGTTWQHVSASSGTVSSVAVTTGTGLTVSGGSSQTISSSGTFALALDSQLIALDQLAGTGFIVQTGAASFSEVSIAGTAGTIVVTNGSGVAGNPTITLATAGTPVSSFFGQIATDVYGRVIGTAPATAANITTALGYTPVDKAGDSMSGVLNMTGNVISNVGTPVAGTDAANKNYVDGAVAGLSWKQEVEAATTVDLGTVVYANGASGVGATLTNGGTQAAFAVDGYTPTVGQRILVKNQADPTQNGIYSVTVVGSGSTNWVLTRVTDLDQTAEFDGAAVFITQGSTQSDTAWVQTDPTVTIGTSNVSWVQFAGSNTYTAGTGLTLTGNQFSLTSPVAVTLGGTGLSSLATNGQLLIGNGSGYTLGTLSTSTGISVTNAAGSITINNTGVTSNVAGTGISVSGATGAVTIANTGTLSITGTANQVLVNGTSGSAQTGAATLTLPQSIATTSSVTFANVTDSALTTDAFIYAGTGGLLSSTAAATNGQLLIGVTGGAPVAAALTAGTAISVTNGAGTITIANTGVTSAVAGTGISVSGATGAVTFSNTGVLSIAGGTTGLTPASATTGAVTLGGILNVANGGTGLSTAPTNGQLLIGNGTGYSLANLTASTGISILNNAGSISIVNTGVTSVALALPSIFTVSGSPVTTTGTLTGDLATQSANLVFAGPTTGSAAAPTFRSLVYADLPLKLYAENAGTVVAPSATGTNAIALGSASVASQYGGVVQASGDFAAAGDAQHGTYVLRGTTTNASQTELFMDGSAADYILPASSVVTFECMVAGINTAVTGAGAGFRIVGVAYRGATVGTSTLIGQVSVTILGRSPNGLNATATVSNTTGALQILVTGTAAATYHWVATLSTTEAGAV